MSGAEKGMAGKTCLVTGASRGIGFHTARALAHAGARVVLVGHNRERGQVAVEKIRAEKDGAPVEFMLADLSRQDETRQFAAAFRENHERLDVLVNNVGGFFLSRSETADGLEKTFALDYLNVFLLTNLLLDLLQESAPARVVNVSSAMHRRARMHFDDLQLESGYSSWEAYGQAKLAVVLFTYELARRLEGTGVTANALHPGFVATNIGQQNALIGLLMKVVYLFRGVSPEEGAQTSVYLATSPEVEGVSAKYFVDQKPVRSSPASYDQEAARKLWEMSEKLTGLANGS